MKQDNLEISAREQVHSWIRKALEEQKQEIIKELEKMAKGKTFYVACDHCKRIGGGEMSIAQVINNIKEL